jgi:Family of unknown function (DUF5715)
LPAGVNVPPPGCAAPIAALPKDAAKATSTIRARRVTVTRIIFRTSSARPRRAFLPSSNSWRAFPTIRDVMPDTQRRAVVVAVVAICIAWSNTARAHRVTQAEYLSVVNNMVTELAPRSAHAAASAREAYAPYVDLLMLADFDQIEDGLATGGLVSLPLDPQRFNVRVRLEGVGPVGEKDLAHQGSYVSARAAAIGCLLDVASRVKSGPIELTSLVRHLDYQRQLRVTNANAATEIPTHALGIAFDIAMVNTPLETVLEIGDVLRKMSDAGDILVIVERQQLVFHVVPHPSRLGWYSEVYARAIMGQRWARPAHQRDSVTPVVTTAIGSLQPLSAWAEEWWAADNVPVDLPISVRVDADDTSDSGPAGVTGRYVALIGELLSFTWQKMLPWRIG